MASTRNKAPLRHFIKTGRVSKPKSIHIKPGTSSFYHPNRILKQDQATQTDPTTPTQEIDAKAEAAESETTDQYQTKLCKEIILPIENGFQSIQALPNDQTACLTDSALQIWQFDHPDGPKMLHERKIAASSMALHSEDCLIVSANNNMIYVLDLKKPNDLGMILGRGTFSILPNGNIQILCNSDNQSKEVKLWQITRSAEDKISAKQIMTPIMLEGANIWWDLPGFALGYNLESHKIKIYKLQYSKKLIREIQWDAIKGWPKIYDTGNGCFSIIGSAIENNEVIYEIETGKKLACTKKLFKGTHAMNDGKTLLLNLELPEGWGELFIYNTKTEVYYPTGIKILVNSLTTLPNGHLQFCITDENSVIKIVEYEFAHLKNQAEKILEQVKDKLPASLAETTVHYLGLHSFYKPKTRAADNEEVLDNNKQMAPNT